MNSWIGLQRLCQLPVSPPACSDRNPDRDALTYSHRPATMRSKEVRNLDLCHYRSCAATLAPNGLERAGATGEAQVTGLSHGVPSFGPGEGTPT